MVFRNVMIFVLFSLSYTQDDEGFCGKDGNDCSDKDSHEATISSMFDNFDTISKKELNQFLLGDNEVPLVLWWDDHFYPHRGKNKVECELGSCEVSNERSVKNKSTLRMIIFSTTHFEASELPLPRLPFHQWALFHGESPKNNWMMSTNIGISLFNYTATFRRESDYPLSTQFLKYPPSIFSDEFFVTTAMKNRYQTQEGLAPAVYVQRDCNPPSGRDAYVRELMKYIRIDSYGPCLNNKKLPEELDGFHHLDDHAYYKFLAKYKFQLAFANALCQDYMTEKIFRPLHIGSVPVYFGSPNISDFMPNEKSVIKVTDFDSPKALAEYLIALNKNDNKYDEYLSHRKAKKIENKKLLNAIERQPWEKVNRYNQNNFGFYMFSQYSCFLCDKIHERLSNIKSYLNGENVTLLPVKTAAYYHMGCPLPQASLPGEIPIYSPVDQFFRINEAKAIHRMIHAGESDASKWRDYVNKDEIHNRKYNGFYEW